MNFFIIALIITGAYSLLDSLLKPKPAAREYRALDWQEICEIAESLAASPDTIQQTEFYKHEAIRLKRFDLFDSILERERIARRATYLRGKANFFYPGLFDDERAFDLAKLNHYARIKETINRVA